MSATLGCTLALILAGCAGPWPPSSHDEGSKGGAAMPAPWSSSVRLDPPTEPNSAPSEMVQVLDKLQQVRAIDPAAEQKLLEELRRAPVSTWPLVAEQFRASLAYHQQLLQKNRAAGRESQPVVDLRRTPSTGPVSGQPAGYMTASSAYERSGTGDDRPSAPIGSLVDPHAAHSEYGPVIARSTPYSMPSPIADETLSGSEPRPPAKFAADGSAFPIERSGDAPADLAERDAAAGQRPHAASQAGAEAGSEHEAKQALAEEVDRPGRAIRLPDTHLPPNEENWQHLIERAVADLERRVSRSPRTTAEVHQHVSLRMLRLLAGDTEQALEPIPHISPTEQDYWSRQIFALATYLDHHSQPDDRRRALASVAHLDEAVLNLRELGSLSLRNLSFCKNVYGFGAVEPYESDTFSPGQHVSLYVEVENYHSTSTDKGYSTSFGTTYEVLDGHGKRVASGDFPDVNDSCRSRRRDFHIQLGLTLPDSITPGRYHLQLVVKDRQSDKIGNAKAAFEIRRK